MLRDRGESSVGAGTEVQWSSSSSLSSNGLDSIPSLDRLEELLALMIREASGDELEAGERRPSRST